MKKNRSDTPKRQAGFLILETLLAMVILTTVILSVFSMISFLQRRTLKSQFDSDATNLLQEGMEITYSSLLANWDKYSDGVYSPAFDEDNDRWVLVDGEETDLNTRFTRSITLSKICRNTSDGTQVPVDTTTGLCLGGERDENSRLVKTKIIWLENGSEKQVEAELLIFNPPNS